jgi:hypothetical protein
VVRITGLGGQDGSEYTLAVKKQINHRVFAVFNQYIYRTMIFGQWQNTFTNTKTGQIFLGKTKL